MASENAPLNPSPNPLPAEVRPEVEATLERGLAARLRNAAARRADRGLERRRRALTALPGGRVSDGRTTWVNFCGNDYLGLATDPSVSGPLAEAARAHGSGSGASALVCGYHPAHRALEQELAEFLEREAVLLCPSGYQANLAVLTALAGRGDRIVQDRLCHASLIDGARLSGADLVRYPHVDVEALARRLGTGQGLVVTDGVFSMDGDTAPLAAIAERCEAVGASLVVDDAHGIGVAGSGGRGSTAAAGLAQDRVPVLVGTLGKAFGCAGAFVAGSAELVDHLVNEARSYVFTTAMPPAMAEAARAALERVREDRWRREKLATLIGRFRDGARARGIELLPSDTPIQPLVVGANDAAVARSRVLEAAGYRVAAIRPPTVPEHTARLRITLSAAHDEQQVEGLLEALDACRT